jgi:hypothetical protein
MKPLGPGVAHFPPRRMWRARYSHVVAHHVPEILLGTVMAVLLALWCASCCAHPAPEVRTVVLPPRVGCLVRPVPIKEPYTVTILVDGGPGAPQVRCGEVPCHVALGPISAGALADDLENYEQYSREAWAACRVHGDGGPP